MTAVRCHALHGIRTWPPDASSGSPFCSTTAMSKELRLTSTPYPAASCCSAAGLAAAPSLPPLWATAAAARSCTLAWGSASASRPRVAAASTRASQLGLYSTSATCVVWHNHRRHSAQREISGSAQLRPW
jgi:hypothetical protein